MRPIQTDTGPNVTMGTHNATLTVKTRHLCRKAPEQWEDERQSRSHRASFI